MKKKKVDIAFSEVAKDTGLSFHRSLLKYGKLKGNYKGYETEIGVYSDINAFGGIGVLLTSLSGEGAFAALEIRNFTGIRIRHNLELEKKKLISECNPLIVIDRDWAYLAMDSVCNASSSIKKHLHKLAETVCTLTSQEVGKEKKRRNE